MTGVMGRFIFGMRKLFRRRKTEYRLGEVYFVGPMPVRKDLQVLPRGCIRVEDEQELSDKEIEREFDIVFIRHRLMMQEKGESCETCGKVNHCKILSSCDGRDERREYVESGVNCWRPAGTVFVFDERPE